MSREQSTEEDVQMSHQDAIALLLGLSNLTFLGCVGVLLTSVSVFIAVGMSTPAFALSVGVLMLYSGRISTLAGGDVRVA